MSSTARGLLNPRTPFEMAQRAVLAAAAGGRHLCDRASAKEQHQQNNTYWHRTQTHMLTLRSLSNLSCSRADFALG